MEKEVIYWNKLTRNSWISTWRNKTIFLLMHCCFGNGTATKLLNSLNSLLSDCWTWFHFSNVLFNLSSLNRFQLLRILSIETATALNLNRVNCICLDFVFNKIRIVLKWNFVFETLNSKNLLWKWIII